MEIFSALLAICAGNSPVTGEFPTQRPVTRSFDVYFDLRPNERLSKQWWGWWFETLSRSLWRHRNELKSDEISLMHNIHFNCNRFAIFHRTLQWHGHILRKFLGMVRQLRNELWASIVLYSNITRQVSKVHCSAPSGISVSSSSDVALAFRFLSSSLSSWSSSFLKISDTAMAIAITWNIIKYWGSRNLPSQRSDQQTLFLSGP